MAEPQFKSFYANSFGLVIGIDSYTDARFPTLGNAETDAKRVADLMSKPPYNFSIVSLFGHDATRQAILGALFNLRSTAPDDRVLVYFAGHGYTLSDQFANETGYLAAADTVPEQDYTALQLEEVTDLRLHARAKHVAFVFDACFSGQALGLTRAPAVAAEKYLARRAYQVISAGAGDQTVADFRSMTTRLIDALENRTIGEQGIITFSQLGLYLNETISSDSGQTQIPQFGHMRGSQGGDFVLYLDTGPRIPVELVDAITSSRANTRLGAVVDLIDMARGTDPDLARLARQKLREVWQKDKDARVRSAAQTFFYEGQDAPESEGKKTRKRDIKIVVEREKPDALLSALDALGGEVTAEEEVPPPTPEELPPEEEFSATAEATETETRSATEESVVVTPSAGETTPTVAETVQPSAATLPSALAARAAAIPRRTWAIIGIGAIVILGAALLLSGLNPAPTAMAPSLTHSPTSSSTLSGDASPTKEVVALVRITATDAPTATAAFTPTITNTAPPTPLGGSRGPLVFALNEGSNWEIFQGNLTGGGQINISNDPAKDDSPVWSPDGSLIAFVSNRDGNREIYVIAPDGSGLINLTNDSADDYDPQWSADGQKIAFISDRDANADVFVMNSDGSGQTNLTRSRFVDAHPTWSPDGKKIAFVSLRGSNRDIYIMNSDGSGLVNPTNNPTDDQQPAWSPDGTMITFASYRDDNWEIYRMDIDGSNVVRLTTHKTDDLYPAWSPDGTKVIFNSNRSGRHQIYMVNLDGTDVIPLTGGTGQHTQASWLP